MTFPPKLLVCLFIYLEPKTRPHFPPQFKYRDYIVLRPEYYTLYNPQTPLFHPQGDLQDLIIYHFALKPVCHC